MRLSLRSITLVALFGTAAAAPAVAQTGPSGASGAQGTQANGGDAALSQYAACPGKPTQADTDAAHGAYTAGKGSFDEADYTTAINYFKDAYRRDCTKNELLIIIARAFELQGNRREAVHALETYLERVPTAPDAEIQKRHIANLKRELDEQAAVAAAAAASAAASAAPAPTTTPAPPPSASPAASAASAPPADSPAHHGHTVAPWVLVAAGGVALVTGGILLGVGSGQVSSAEGVCGSSHLCPQGSAGASAISQGNSGRTNETVGVVVGGVGAAAVVGGLLWHFFEHTGPADQHAARPSVTPEVGPGYAGFGLAGQF